MVVMLVCGCKRGRFRECIIFYLNETHEQTHHAITFQTPSYIASINILLTKSSHMAKASISGILHFLLLHNKLTQTSQKQYTSVISVSVYQESGKDLAESFSQGLIQVQSRRQPGWVPTWWPH